MSRAALSIHPYADSEDDLEEPILETDDLDEESWQAESDKEFGPEGNRKLTSKELEEWADKLLREDANRELCRTCKDGGLETPYGHETGDIEWLLQKDKEGNAKLDDEGNALYVAFPELRCDKGHRWYKGESGGVRRDIRGPNPILFETHLYNRKRREIHVKDGVPDPAFTMDRWGKRPTQGMYIRTHPQGRKVNTDEQRKTNGASFYR